MSLLFLLFATSTVLVAMDEAQAKHAIGAAIASVLLFRGILGLREMKRLIRENKAQQEAADAGNLAQQPGEAPPAGPLQ